MTDFPDFRTVAHAPQGINERWQKNVVALTALRDRESAEFARERVPESSVPIVLNCKRKDGRDI
jgi:hypothetical protein